MKIETKVGLFVAFGLIFLFALTTQVNNFNLFKPAGYKVYSYIGNVDGLEQNAKVKSNGIVIGSVTDFWLDRNKVVVLLNINKDIKIPEDSVVSVKQESMLGVRYFNIQMGRSPLNLAQNDYIVRSEQSVSFDDVAKNINQASTDFRGFIQRVDALVAANQSNFNQMILHFNRMGYEFEQTGKMLNQRLPVLIDKFSAMSDEFKLTGETINKNLPTVLNKFQLAEDNFNGMIQENRPAIKNAISNIDSTFSEINTSARKIGSAFDKIDAFLASTTQSQMNVHFYNQYLTKDQYNKIYFGVDYSPKPTIHYLIDLISTDDYRKGIGTELHEQSRNLISAQYAKDFNNMTFRAGIIESTGGLGFDYATSDKKVTASLDLFDFNAYNDIRGDKPNLKTTLRYNYMKHVNVYGGYDNLLNQKSRNGFIGFGVKFIDQDLKYLLGSSGGFVK